MKKIWMSICTLSLAAALLAGCGSQTAQADPIGIDAAKAAALEDAGVPADAVTYTTAGLDRKNGTEYYAVVFTANGQTYEYDIDAVTGVVIEKKVPGGTAAPADDDAAQTSGAQDAQTGTQTAGAQTGTQTAGGQSNGSVIGEEAAKTAALTHAGLAESDVTFLRSYLEWDDGRQVYDVEFYTADYQEYDYEIDALTGAVLSYDYDAEYYGGQSGTGTTITAEEAKAMALAKVPGATEADIWEFSTDRDDGRIEYEGEIIYDGMKYEFEIDGYSGTIRSWEAEARRG